MAVLKHHPNSFHKSTLKAILDAARVEATKIVGTMSHVCIDGTARAASDYGYAVTVVADACATRDVEHRGVVVPAAHVHAAIMGSLAFGYGVVVTADEYLRE